MVTRRLFAPQPCIEKVVAEKAVAIKSATIAALKGEEAEKKARSNRINADWPAVAIQLQAVHR